MNLNELPMLRDNERIASKKLARNNLLKRAGDVPKFEHFLSKEIQTSPTWTNIISYAILAVFFAFGLLPSAFRIFQVASDTFAKGVPSAHQAVVVGVSFVVMAETAVILFSWIMATKTLPNNVRRFFQFGILLATAIAILGNIQIGVQHTAESFNWLLAWLYSLQTEPFAFLEAVAPPVFTLIGGLALERLLLDSVQTRHNAKIQFEQALAERDKLERDIETSSAWENAYAWALWDTFVAKLRKSRKEELLAQIDNTLRDQFVWREMQADEFFSHSSEYSVNMQNNRIQKNIHNKNIHQNMQVKTANAQQVVIEHFKEYPEDVERDQRELAELLNVSQPTVSRAVRKFQSNGYHEN